MNGTLSAQRVTGRPASITPSPAGGGVDTCRSRHARISPPPQLRNEPILRANHPRPIRVIRGCWNFSGSPNVIEL